MNLIENYYTWNLNSIIISKVLLKKEKNIPQIKKLLFYFILKANQYKKNNLLFFILISLIYGNIFILKNKKYSDFQVFNLVLKKKNLNFFYLILLIHIYL